MKKQEDLTSYIERVFEKLKNGINYKEITDIIIKDNGIQPENYENFAKRVWNTLDKSNKFTKIKRGFFDVRTNDVINTHYGFQWRKDEIAWKHPHLIGYKPNKTEIHNFDKLIGVYVLYDRDDRIVYVGQSNKKTILERLTAHTKDHLANEWSKFSWFGFPKNNENKRLYTEDLILFMEAVLIRSIKPKHNGSGGKKFKGILYNQKVY